MWTLQVASITALHDRAEGGLPEDDVGAWTSHIQALCNKASLGFRADSDSGAERVFATVLNTVLMRKVCP